jgi:galactose mutarotase-like enzyme
MEAAIKNDCISIRVKHFGAELTSLKKNDTLELLWQGDEKYWQDQSPILFPFVGGLPDDEYQVGGRTYKTSHHGFASSSLFQLVERTDKALIFRLKENEKTLEQYPYRFTLDISYTLEANSLIIGYSIINKDERLMYFSIGAHPGFRCPLFENESMDDYYLEFEKCETAFRRFKEGGLLTGDKEQILREEDRLRLSHDLFYKDAIILDNLRSSWVELRSCKNNQVIRVEFEGFPYLGIWSSKNDGPFICIEPWYGVDSTHGASNDLAEKEGMQVLKPGETFHCQYRITV